MTVITEINASINLNNSNTATSNGFEQFLAAKMKVKQGKNDSQFYFDKSDADLKHIILSLANRLKKGTFSQTDVSKKFKDFTPEQRLLIIQAINKFKNYSRELPRYFSPFDAEDKRIRN